MFPLVNDVCVAGVPNSSTLLRGLVAYWKMDETSGDRVDIHRGHDLTPSTVGNAAGKLGNAATLTKAGTSSLVNTDSAFDFGVNDVEVAGWVKLTIGGTQEFINTHSAAAASGFYIVKDATDAIVVFLVDGAGAAMTKAWSPVVDTWYWISLAMDRDGLMTLRIDNAVHQTVSIAAFSSSVSGLPGVQFGRLVVPTYADCDFDEWGFWNRLLTTTERAKLYSGGTGRTYPFL